MGREIKFRCWFKNEMAQQMLYDERPGDCLVWKNQGQDIEAIMQFTGLHDKNGKEIYEGDIIKHGYEDEPQVVEWSERICCYKINSTEVSERYLIKVDEEGGLMEVIGNQFENPELLEGERRNG